MQRHGLMRSLAIAAFMAVAITSLALAGCGSNASTSVDKHLIIATDFPVSGGDATDTLPAEYAVNMAVSQATLPGGYTLSVLNKDDEGTSGADPNVGASNITQLISNAEVVAIVGPFNSGVAGAEIPLINNAGGPVEISPTNTNPGLTLSQYATQYGFNFSQLHPAGKPDYYFRIPANDVSQGAADATIALSSNLGNLKSAFIVDDNTPYGQGLADFFTQTFTQMGGSTVGTRQSITSNQISVLPALATTIKNSHAQLVFYGGVTSQGGCKLKLALVQAGFKGPMVGGDGIADDPGCLKDAGAGAAGIVGTVAAPDPTSLTSTAAQTFVTAYNAYAAGKQDGTLLPYSAQAYDAAEIEITAIKNLINGNQTVTGSAGRLNIRNAIANITYPGVTGTISFDANGDNSGSKVFSVYAITPQAPTKWSFIQIVNVAS